MPVSAREERLLHVTTSLCRTCRQGLPARVLATADGRVRMDKACPTHGPQSVQLSDDAAWYERTRARMPPLPGPRGGSAPRGPKREATHGCPFDCGPCTQHVQAPRMPVVTITSSCNLSCPMCFVHNRNEGAYHMPLEEFRGILRHLQATAAGADGLVDVINLTGGEATLHPRLFELLEAARDAGVHRVSLCSHGLKLGKDEAYVRRLGELGARVAISFDTFDDEVDFALNGVRSVKAKLAALDVLERNDVDVTLIPVVTGGKNDHELGRILDMAVARTNVRHVEIHTITFTGQGGRTFPRETRISLHEVLLRVAETTPWLREDDFVPSPCAHPLCYHICYLLLDPAGGPPIPFTRLMGPDVLYRALGDRLYLEPTPALESALQEAINTIWSDDPPDADRMLGALRHMLDALFPAGRVLEREEALRRAERLVKAIYVHSHMDEDTFDTERAALCCDVNVKPDGRTVPVCNDNILYRDKEPAFNLAPSAWGDRDGGDRAVRERVEAASPKEPS